MELLLQLTAAASILSGNLQHYEPPHASKVAFQYAYQKEQERLKVEAEKAKIQSSNKIVQINPTHAVKPGGVSGSDHLDRIAKCESGNRNVANPSGKYRGYFQFDMATYQNNGGSGDPMAASYEEQKRVAQNLYNRRGAAPWPTCGRR